MGPALPVSGIAVRTFLGWFDFTIAALLTKMNVKSSPELNCLN